MARVDSEWEKVLKKSQPSFFSDEIMFEILSRLPLKSIIRFKCVCKKWYELIGDSSFNAVYLKRSVEGFIYRSRKDDSFYEGTRRVGYYLNDKFFKQLPELPSQTEPFLFNEILASVDGLLCVRRFSLLKSSLLLWNPATRESTTVPECPKCIHHAAIGFGFDPKNSDYKVVVITFSKGYVYSLRNDRWRRSFRFYNFSVLHNRGVHVNGRLHWLAEKRGSGDRMLIWLEKRHRSDNCRLDWLTKRSPSDRFIFSFDLTEEKIVEICVPVNLKLDGLVSLKTFRESLVLHLDNDGKTEIWFMEKYGDSKLWSVLYSIPLNPLYGRVLRCEWFFHENGKVIMQCSDTRNMISYDPKNQVYKVLRIDGGADIIDYKESLVSVGDRSFSDSCME